MSRTSSPSRHADLLQSWCIKAGHEWQNNPTFGRYPPLENHACTLDDSGLNALSSQASVRFYLRLHFPFYISQSVGLDRPSTCSWAQSLFHYLGRRVETVLQWTRISIRWLAQKVRQGRQIFWSIWGEHQFDLVLTPKFQRISRTKCCR